MFPYYSNLLGIKKKQKNVAAIQKNPIKTSKSTSMSVLAETNNFFIKIYLFTINFK